jgi:ubiquinone/menaquinone biosynthesis C-methylase UbiE
MAPDPPFPPHPDPFRYIDASADPSKLVDALELRGRTAAQGRVRRRFLRFAGIQPGDRVLEVGCGTGVVLRDLARLVGPRGQVTGVDPSRRAIDAARVTCQRRTAPVRMDLRVADGMDLPFASRRFDAALAVTVVLHVGDPARLTREMARVVRTGGRIALQDQDFGTLAVTHPDRELTDTIMRGVASRIYEEPYSGRRLTTLLRDAGISEIRLRTDVFQDTELVPYTQNFLERRAENAVRFGILDTATAQQWLDGFNALVAAHCFVFTLNYYGAMGVKPEERRRGR